MDSCFFFFWSWLFESRIFLPDHVQPGNAVPLSGHSLSFSFVLSVCLWKGFFRSHVRCVLKGLHSSGCFPASPLRSVDVFPFSVKAAFFLSVIFFCSCSNFFPSQLSDQARFFKILFSFFCRVQVQPFCSPRANRHAGFLVPYHVIGSLLFFLFSLVSFRLEAFFFSSSFDGEFRFFPSS